MTLTVVALVAVMAPLFVDLTRLRLPVVVLEILLGILVGPQVFGWATNEHAIGFLSRLGMSMLFFLAGFEFDFKAIRGRPLRLGIESWFISLLLALCIGGALQ